jgi:GNAT superfamily N-acetyltransferase
MKREDILKALSNIDKQFITHLSISSWGESILIMKKDGKAFIRVYWFNDEDRIIYLDWLSVEESERKKGIATKLLKIVEKIGIDLDGIKLRLWVERDTWQQEWYQRLEYEHYLDKEENTIWMQKDIIQ